MINSRGECKLGRLEGVVCGEMDVQEEHTTLVWRLRWTENSSLECTHFVIKVIYFKSALSYLPMERVIPHWTRRALGRGVVVDVLELLVDPLESHNECSDVVLC